MKIGLYFGSFNPIHSGHMMVASYCLNELNLDELRFVLSPQNPFKKNLLDFSKRMMMLNIAIEDNPKMKISDIEYHLPQPSYTINTLDEINKTMKEDDEIFIIMGLDCWTSIKKWKDYQRIISENNIIVYPRIDSVDCNTEFKETLNTLENVKNVMFMENAPLCSLSSTFIRNEIKKGHGVRHYLPNNKLEEFITQENIYCYD